MMLTQIERRKKSSSSSTMWKECAKGSINREHWVDGNNVNGEKHQMSLTRCLAVISVGCCCFDRREKWVKEPTISAKQSNCVAKWQLGAHLAWFYLYVISTIFHLRHNSFLFLFWFIESVCICPNEQTNKSSLYCVLKISYKWLIFFFFFLSVQFSFFTGIWHAAAQLWLVQTF